MNNKPNHDPLARLISSAREYQDPRALDAPLGFSTRIAAQAMTAKSSGLAMAFERLSWKALGISAALMVVCVASSYQFTSSPTTSDDESDILSQDPVSAFVELSS